MQVGSGASPPRAVGRIDARHTPCAAVRAVASSWGRVRTTLGTPGRRIPQIDG